MLNEYYLSSDSSDSQAALVAVLELIQKVQEKLTPWHVRYRDSLALAVNVVGGVIGAVTAVAGIFS